MKEKERKKIIEFYYSEFLSPIDGKLSSLSLDELCVLHDTLDFFTGTVLQSIYDRIEQQHLTNQN